MIFQASTHSITWLSKLPIMSYISIRSVIYSDWISLMANYCRQKTSSIMNWTQLIKLIYLFIHKFDDRFGHNRHDNFFCNVAFLLLINFKKKETKWVQKPDLYKHNDNNFLFSQMLIIDSFIFHIYFHAHSHLIEI